MIPAGLPTSWPTTSFGGPARWARSIPVLVDYLRPRYPTLTFLGGLGDQSHVAEGNTSAHNPITLDPVTGEGIVLAVDLGVTDGDMAPLLEIRSLIYAHPRDPRMAGGVDPVGSGYLSGPDDKANNWPFGSGWNGGNSDIGHLHVNVAAKFFPFQPAGYLSSMDLETPWDFMASASPEGDNDMGIRVYQQWGSTAQWAIIGGFIAVAMYNPDQTTVWLDMPDCLSKAVEKPDETHWGQIWRGVAIRVPVEVGTAADVLAGTANGLAARIDNATQAGNNATSSANNVLQVLKALIPAPVVPAVPQDLAPLVTAMSTLPKDVVDALRAAGVTLTIGPSA